jgi:hypothetical protein
MPPIEPPARQPTTESHDGSGPAPGVGWRKHPALTEDGRLLGTAGRAIVVALLAVVFGALLIAPGLHKTSYNGQPGTKRDVSLAVTGALAGVSHALLLDRPRVLLQDALGRGDEDEIDVAIVVPAKPAPRGPSQAPAGKPAASKPPVKVAFTPERRLRLWIAGDSLVITPGYSIVRAAGASPVIESVGGIDGHVATGLTRPDVFNWFAEIAGKVKKLHPHVVVLNFGANDNHAYMTGIPEGTSIG